MTFMKIGIHRQPNKQDHDPSLIRSIDFMNMYIHQTQHNKKQETSKLVLLATRWAYLPWIEEDTDLSRSLLNFAVLGTTLIVVDNARAPPPRWRYRTRVRLFFFWDEGRRGERGGRS